MKDIRQPTPELIVTNFHRRFTGVSSTTDAVISKQIYLFRVCLVGDDLPRGPKPISYRRAVSLCRKPPEDRPFTIWHVRRNLEMAAAIFARDVLRLPIRIVFTSAAQRVHSFVPRQLIAKMDAVVATTDKAACLVPKLAAVVPHGVDIDRFIPSQDRKRDWAELGLPGQYGIGIVGRIRPEKGTDLFVDSMIRLLPQRPEFTAVVIGRAMPADAAFESSLKARIQSAGLTDRFGFIGEHPSKEMPSIIRSLSLLVAPARYEGYGMTPLEAMSCGVPVIASDTGVYAEIVNPSVGKIVPIDDTEALVEALVAMTESVTNLETMGKSARILAEEKLSLQAEAAGYSALLQRIWRGETFC